ncbi:MAG: HD domain-containing phosphohydrolase [bacterium]
MQADQPFQSMGEADGPESRFPKIVCHSPDTRLEECADFLREKGLSLKSIESLTELAPQEGALTIVLLDQRLAGEEGLRRLEELAKAPAPLAAVYVSAEGEAGTVPDAAFAVYVSGVLQKPFNRSSLLLALLGAFRHSVSRYSSHQERAQRLSISRNLENLTQIGIALSAEKNLHRLLDLILTRSRELTNADAGSLYLVEESEDGERSLRFKHTQNDSKDIPFQEFAMPATTASISGYVAVTGETLNIPDVYNLPDSVEYSFNKSFDQSVNYRSKSMLVVPMKDHDNIITGVLQLINAKSSSEARISDPESAEREVISFDPSLEEIISALASQAAVSLDNSMLLESIEATFEGLVKASVHAIEQRDPVTSGHSERVTDLTCALAQAVHETAEGRYSDTGFTEEQMKELRYAGLLHDFGKIGVREQVLVKANKLYPLEMEVVKNRFNLIRRTIQAEYQEKMLSLAMEGKNGEVKELQKELAARLEEAGAHLDLVTRSNVPSMMPEGEFDELEKLGTLTYIDLDGNEQPYITPEELNCLTLTRGNLTSEERKEIESHASHSYNFLVQIPWTRYLRGVPEIAHAHHEKLNGEGYPLGLKEEEITLQSKMMCVCDIFDALTATDRPYKKAAPLEKAIQILKFEVKDQHLDPALVDIFIKEKVYQAVENFHDVEYQEPEPKS